MREKPAIIKAINALKGASFDEPIHHIPDISDKMAMSLVEVGYATRIPWSKDPSIFCYCLTAAGYDALKAKSNPKPVLTKLPPRIPPLPPRLK